MSREITQLLLALDTSKASIDKLLPMVYEELQKMTRRQLCGESSNHTINPTGCIPSSHHQTSYRLPTL